MLDNLFEILGIDETASDDEIRKAFLTKSKEHHPDKGGDKDEFTKINHAYQILSNKKTRIEYIKTGDVKQKTEYVGRAKKEIMALLFTILNSNDDSIFSSNVPSMIMKIIDEQNLENHKNILKSRKDIKRLKIYKQRFIKKPEFIDDFISDGISLEMDMKRNEIDSIIDKMKILREMKKLLTTYEFCPKMGLDFN